METLSDCYTIYHECVNAIEDSFEQVEKIEFITRNPSSYINEHFDQTKRNINLRSEDLVAKINRYRDELIKQNEVNRSRCLESFDQVNENMTTTIGYIKSELDQLRQLFEKFNSDIRIMRPEFQTICTYLKNQINQKDGEYKEALFHGLIHQEPLFVFCERSIEDFFGKVINKNQVFLVSWVFEHFFDFMRKFYKIDLTEVEPIEEDIYRSYQRLPDAPTNTITDKKVDDMLDDILESEQQVNLPLLKVDSAISCLRPEKVINEVKCFIIIIIIIYL